MPEGEEPKPGLGTGIVEALAGQLEAIVTIADAKPGVCVSISHDGENAELTAA